MYISDSGSSLKLFESLKSRLEQGLPNENIEWKRSFGRASKSVAVHAKFVPLESVSLSSDPKSITTLLGHPMLHTYWTECSVSIYTWLTYFLYSTNVSDINFRLNRPGISDIAPLPIVQFCHICNVYHFI